MIDETTDCSNKEQVVVVFTVLLEHCHGQSFDGASVMTGARNGVAEVISDEELQTIFSHSYGQALNLGVGNTISSVR